ncbi:MAG TPA: peptidylprolyl isomerase, partial [Pseudomonadales bacterium]|nr:peptidylprolyl isomerase [Pseudomonadales bacterium]
DEAGEQLEHSVEDGPMVYLHGHGNILPALERKLAGKSVGDQLSATLPPGDAYGERQDDAIQRVPIKHLVTRTKRFKPGMVVRVNTKQGPRDVTITKVGKFNVDVDVNHPYAGRTLTFDITVQTIRDASPEELSHGHAHGVSGDSHH